MEQRQQEALQRMERISGKIDGIINASDQRAWQIDAELRGIRICLEGIQNDLKKIGSSDGKFTIGGQSILAGGLFVAGVLFGLYQLLIGK